MAELVKEGDHFEVRLSGREKFGTVRKHSPRFPLSAIKSVERLPNARKAIRGLRWIGTGFPGVVALGTWRSPRARDFVATYRNDAGYVIELEGQFFDRLVVSNPPVEFLDNLVRSRNWL